MAKQPVLRPVPIDGAPGGVPQVTEIHYDVWTLRIALDFDGWDGVVYVDFESPPGFRVLDEDDLPEMRKAEGRTKHWLHAVEANGWLTQEASRAGFSRDLSELSEYLICGLNDCVSVIAFDEPDVTVVGEEAD